MDVGQSSKPGENGRMRKAYYIMVFAAALLLGCSSETKSGPAEPTTPQIETGRFAFQKMLVAARIWARDAQPIQLASQPSKDSSGHDGKSSFWRATFASPTRLKSEQFTWSGTADADTPRGLAHNTEDPFNPANRSTQPFDVNFLKIDSDQAFAVAQQHGGKEMLAKKPAQAVIYLLDFDSATSQLRWHVIYGDSPGSAPLTVIVDASTGLFLHKD
jgi:hypothetical protein